MMPAHHGPPRLWTAKRRSGAAGGTTIDIQFDIDHTGLHVVCGRGHPQPPGQGALARLPAAPPSRGGHRLRAAQQLAVPGATPVRGSRCGHQDRATPGRRPPAKARVRDHRGGPGDAARHAHRAAARPGRRRGGVPGPAGPVRAPDARRAVRRAGCPPGRAVRPRRTPSRPGHGQPRPPVGRRGGRRAGPPHYRRAWLAGGATRPRRRAAPTRGGTTAMTTSTENQDPITVTGGPPRARLGAWAQYGLLAGPLLSMLDASIVNVAVAPIARQLHAPLTQVGWAVSGYLLALGVGLTATSWLARRFGTLPVYTASVLGFTLASAGCAAAPDVRLLIAARLGQGLAGAPLAAGALLLAGYAARAARHPHPVLDLALLRRRTPALGMLLCALASVVTFAAVFVLPVFAQAVQGHSAAAAGLALL